LYHLNRTRGWTGIAARSIMRSHLLDKFVAKIGIEVTETPVGLNISEKLWWTIPINF
jgi:phosphoglucomutase